MRKEIIFTGFGGQGIILMGVIIARMMEHFPELEVTQAQSYGPASRGGACSTTALAGVQVTTKGQSASAAFGSATIWARRPMDVA